MHLLNVEGRQHNIYSKYSASQTYFYCKTINDITKAKLTSTAIIFQDLECYHEVDEYLKRIYNRGEFPTKMSTFKEYYFYHKDCPRIFMKEIQFIYAKWQDRKRNIMYKNLKHLFDKDKSARTITQSQEEYQPLPNFLYELSQYNPFSKKYYLRIEEKQKSKKKINEEQRKLESKDQISELKHQLSDMLQQMNELSMISTLDSKRIESKSKIYHRKSVTQTQAAHDYSNSAQLAKVNFKKKYQQNVSTHATTKIEKQISRLQLDKNQLQSECNQFLTVKNARISQPKVHVILNKQGPLQKIKSKSNMGSVYPSLNKENDEQFKIKLNTKRQGIKLSIQMKNKKEGNFKVINNKQKSKQKLPKKYESLQKTKQRVIIRSKSNGKLSSQHQNNNAIFQLRNRQNSLKKLKTNPNQFCDKKLQILAKNPTIKLSSYKSEHIDLKKPAFKIKPTQIYLGKAKKQQLKI